jgi:PII-like signaling protein
MENNPNAKLLRIFIGESDKAGHQPLYEAIVFEAKKQSLSGATVTRGIMGFGANS